jgi:hypothetical protein
MVDRMLGELLTRLEETGILDESLLIVTADHGVSYRAGVPRRAITSDNAYEVGLVPLFIKAPHQTEGLVKNDPARSIDVMPTLAALLGFDLPWHHDGESLLARGDDLVPLHIDTAAGSVILSELESGMTTAVNDKVAKFGSGSSESLYAFGEHAALVGRASDSVASEPSGLTAEVDEAWRFDHVAPYTGFVPGFIHARLFGSVDSDTHVAVAVNGQIRTVVPTQNVSAQGAQFSAIVPDDAFVSGFNQLELLSVTGSSISPVAGFVEIEGNERFELEVATTGRVTRLLSSDGDSWPNKEDSTIVGFVDAAEWYNSDFPVGSPKDLELPGWAIRVSSLQPVEEIVFFVNGVYAGSARPEFARADIEAAYESDDVRLSGFVGRLAQFLPSQSFVVRAFALSNGVSEELTITDEARADIAAG